MNLTSTEKRAIKKKVRYYIERETPFFKGCIMGLLSVVTLLDEEFAKQLYEIKHKSERRKK